MMQTGFILTVLLACVCSAQNQVQEEWHRYEMKDPQVDIAKCGRYQKSMICDPNQILETEHGKNFLMFWVIEWASCWPMPLVIILCRM